MSFAFESRSVAVVGAAETTEMGTIPNQSVLGLHADAALNAIADAGLTTADIDGVATAGTSPTEVAYYLGITPKWVDGTSVGGCSFMLHVRHAAAAIAAGHAHTILITHAESGRSRVGAGRRGSNPSSLSGQFEDPFGVGGPPTRFTIPWLRYAKTYGVDIEKLANVSVVQREWAGLKPTSQVPRSDHARRRARFDHDRQPVHEADVLPRDRRGWRLILTSADRARDLPRPPAYILGTGESVETPLISQMADFTSSARVSESPVPKHSPRPASPQQTSIT